MSSRVFLPMLTRGSAGCDPTQKDTAPHEWEMNKKGKTSSRKPRPRRRRSPISTAQPTNIWVCPIKGRADIFSLRPEKKIELPTEGGQNHLSTIGSLRFSGATRTWPYLAYDPCERDGNRRCLLWVFARFSIVTTKQAAQKSRLEASRQGKQCCWLRRSTGRFSVRAEKGALERTNYRLL